jgi:hypothetical protein
MRVPENCQRRGSEKVSAQQMARTLAKAEDFLGKDFVFDETMGWTDKRIMPLGELRSMSKLSFRDSLLIC